MYFTERIRDSYDLRVWNVEPVQNVGIENLKIYRDDTGDSGTGTNIIFEYSVNCWVKGIESELTCRHHVDIQYSSHIEVSGCYFHRARDYDDGGRGYGVVLNFSTTNCLIENNIFKKLRHAMLVQAGANCNVFIYNYSREQKWNWTDLGPDICLHGNYPYANLFEHNYVERIIADDTHGDNGKYNAFVRNTVIHDDIMRYITIINAPNSSCIGCNLTTDYSQTLPIVTSGNTTLAKDLYGVWIESDETYETGEPFTHYMIAIAPIYKEACHLLDNSYYYSERPDFVSELNYSFPTLGPPDLLVTQNIPAKYRYDKTYINDPTIAPVLVVIDQKDASGSSFGEIEHWEEGWVSYPYQDIVQCRVGSDQIFRADQNLNGDEKFLDWNEEYFLNHNTFTIVENMTNITAHHDKVKTVTLKNEVLYGVVTSSSGNIEFKDPWLIEYNDPPYGMRNRGMDAPFKSKASPLNLTLDSEYKGVFLNQNEEFDTDKAIYSVKAPYQIIPIEGRGDVKWLHYNWKGNSEEVDFKNADNDETLIVFKQPNAEAIAVYKGHLCSANSRATGYNNGRRIAKGNGDALHSAYEDNGEIWYTSSPDNGKNWEKEIRISGKSSEDVYYTNPSITFTSDYYNVHIVWECVDKTTYGDIHDIEYRRKNCDGWTETTNISSPYLFFQEKDMRPVIHVLSYGSLYIAWAAYTESENKYYIYIKRRDGEGEWGGINEVPGVNGYPLIDYFNAGLHKTVIVWPEDGDIKYIDGKYVNNDWEWSATKNLTSNFNSETHNNCNPTMSIDGTDGIGYIAWEANRISDDKKCLYYCKYDLTDAAGPSRIGYLTLIDSYDNQIFNPTISWDRYDDLLTLFYQKDSKIYRSRNDGTSEDWDTKCFSYGNYPSVCYNNETGAVWTKYDDAPYMIVSDWGNITGSVSWSDKVVLESNVYVESGATLTIEPGAEIKLDDGVKITVEEGGKIIANGASSEKIKFLRSNEDQAWDKILLEGDNNEFSHCIFDGGYYNVDVRSRYNTFTNCTFKNGVRGINTYKRPQGDWSCFELSNCTFENNSNGGVVALYTYGAINSCTIKNNPGYGLYLYNARIGNNFSYGDKCGLFRDNYIHNNGTYGVVLAYNGILWSGYDIYKGYNNIYNNGSHEIYLQNYTNARFYDSKYGGYSSIYDQSGGRYIYNLSKTYNGEYYVAATVVAENNYWGCASGPSSSNFYGPVDYTPYLSENLPGINAVGDNSENGGEVLSEGIVNSICSSAAGSGVSGSGGGQGLVDLKNKIQELRNRIDNNPDDLSNARRLNEMYSLLTDYDPEDILKEKQPLLEKIAGYRQRLLDNPSGSESVQLIGETAMLLEINNLTEKKEYDNAMAMLNDYDKYIKNSDNRRELLSNKLAVFEDMGEYEQALAVLIDLREEVKGDHDHYTPPTYEIIEQNLKNELGIDDDPHAKGNAPENDAFDIAQKLDFALYNNYPNPFNPTTKIPFSLAENSHIKIEVFDILGKRVAILANRIYQKGMYNVEFNGKNLATGLYIIRTEMKSKENKGKKYTFLRKMLLVK